MKTAYPTARIRLQPVVTGFIILALISLAGCAQRSPFEEKDGPPRVKKDISTVKKAVPKVEPRARYGNHSPYEVFGKTYHVMASSEGYREEGIASWYGEKFAGRFTSSMEPYDPWAMTAAHKALPLPTYVKVTNLANNRSVIVRVNDRGPFHGHRIIDLSYAAAIKLDFANKGTARVLVEAIDPRQPEPRHIVADTAPPQPSAEAAVNYSASAPASERIYLQAGAFRQLDSARRLRDQLQALLNAEVAVRTEGSNASAIHRVFIGPFPSEQHALAAQSVVRDTELANPLLVRR